MVKTKRIIHFTAIHPISKKAVDMYFYSLNKAKKANPGLTNWQEKGTVDDKEVP